MRCAEQPEQEPERDPEQEEPEREETSAGVVAPDRAHDMLPVVTDVHFVLLTVVLAWLQIMVAAELRTPTWTKAGAKLAFGNRGELPPASAVAARADRATKNMLENLVLFIGVYVAAKAAGATVTTQAALFFGARLAYFGVYVAGITIVRSLLWGVSLAALAWMGIEAL